MIRIIGDDVLAAEPTMPIKLGLLVMSRNNSRFIDPFVDIPVGPGPMLREVLNDAGLSLEQIKERYGDNAFSWTPFGPGRTIIDLMEELRVKVQQYPFKSEHRFHWEPHDLVEELSSIKNESDFRRCVDEFGTKPSAVIVDTISLYNPLVSRFFSIFTSYRFRSKAVFHYYFACSNRSTDGRALVSVPAHN